MNDIDLLLNAQIETLLDRVSISALKETVKRLSNTYQTNNIDRSNIVNDDTFALAYIAYRMPTTYQAIKKPLRELFNIDKNISTVLDIGSGPFTCYWALSCLVSNINITCLEKQTSMIKTGKS